MKTEAIWCSVIIFSHTAIFHRLPYNALMAGSDLSFIVLLHHTRKPLLHWYPLLLSTVGKWHPLYVRPDSFTGSTPCLPPALAEFTYQISHFFKNLNSELLSFPFQVYVALLPGWRRRQFWRLCAASEEEPWFIYESKYDRWCSFSTRDVSDTAKGRIEFLPYWLIPHCVRFPESRRWC